ncbi:MAG TPA: TRAP transporter small permease [Burkholderiales bacterium]|jgi:TRAP-type C4-dicarboxylate transport system permease small subunit|nr:TRAP transporter small permease [Burkholderiales bacterium]
MPDDDQPFEHPQNSRSPAPPRIERVLMALVMAALLVITMANVIVRYLTDVSFAYTEEISVWLLVVLTLVGTVSALFTGKHIAVTIVIDQLPQQLRRAGSMLAGIATLAMFVLLAWYGTRMAWDDYSYQVTSPALGIPRWLYTVWLPLLSALVAVRVIQLMVHAWRRRV